MKEFSLEKWQPQCSRSRLHTEINYSHLIGAFQQFLLILIVRSQFGRIVHGRWGLGTRLLKHGGALGTRSRQRGCLVLLRPAERFVWRNQAGFGCTCRGKCNIILIHSLNMLNPIRHGIWDTPIRHGGGVVKIDPPYFPQKCSEWAVIFQTYVKQKFLKKQKFSSK